MIVLIKLKKGMQYLSAFYNAMQCINRLSLSKSRNLSAKKYRYWIRHCEGAIVSWYCKCKAGSRVVGCCAHITSVLWYLAFARHQFTSVKGVRNWADHLDDAARVVDESDSGAESPTEE